jgi:acetyl esterase
MTAIDPDVRIVLEQMDASVPAPGGFDVAFFRAMAEGNPGGPSSIALAAVQDTLIPGADGVPLRLYRPELTGSRPAIMFIHGGGFILRGLASHDEMCRRLAAGTGGGVVIAVDCRPSPEHPYPAAVDDACTAVKHIAGNAGALGLDASRIVLAGISSGAAIAAGTTLRCRDAGGPGIALQVLLTPMLRHREATPSRQAYGHGGYGITAALLDWYSDQYAPGTAADDPYCAPLQASDLRGLPPAYIHTAACDPLRDDGADYAQRLRHAGVPVEHRDAAGLFHGFHFFTDALPRAREEVTAELEAIRRMLAASAAPGARMVEPGRACPGADDGGIPLRRSRASAPAELSRPRSGRPVICNQP